MNKTKLSKLTDNDLYLYHANATATAYGSIGHNKSAVNKSLIKIYETELSSRGLPVPTEEEKFSNSYGDMNGIGSDITAFN